MKKRIFSGGYTLPELLITMGIFAILVSLVTINLTYSQQNQTNDTTITTLISDIKEQQLKAMVGDTEGRATPDVYGIYFEANRYTLFHGNTYSASDPTNFVINLNPTLQFIPINKTLLFLKLSGQVSGYSSGANTITLKNTTTNDQKTIRFNQFGIVTQLN